ncbi:hypothetical protein AB0K12_45190 [Nonomuraea sp. NPDC049419]|uniref:hypothetical protein n=1 Tax=Nonomuraea sp. NPDC049419 TaxID=3155772 RepID=UPI003428D47B
MSHEVEQIVETALSVIAGPTVQLGLDLQYPVFGLHQDPWNVLKILMDESA